MSRYIVLTFDGSLFWTETLPRPTHNAIVFDCDNMRERSPDTKGRWVKIRRAQTASFGKGGKHGTPFQKTQASQ
jgi:hypothetical protein